MQEQQQKAVSLVCRCFFYQYIYEWVMPFACHSANTHNWYAFAENGWRCFACRQKWRYCKNTLDHKSMATFVVIYEWAYSMFLLVWGQLDFLFGIFWSFIIRSNQWIKIKKKKQIWSFLFPINFIDTKGSAMPTVTPIQGPIFVRNGSVPVVPLFSYPTLNNGTFIQIPVSI